MVLTRKQLNNYWPDVYIGDKNIKDIDTTGVELEELDDDAPTPDSVKVMLGFDPLELFDD